MRICIVSYMGYDGPGVMHAHHFANQLQALGHDVLFLLNGDTATAKLMSGPPEYELRQVTFQEGLLEPELKKAIARFRPEVVHLWTPRHLPARVGLEISVSEGANLIIHYEDDEEYILKHFGGNRRFSDDDVALYRLFESEELDLEKMQGLVGCINVEFLRATVLDPPAWPWVHPIVSGLVARMADACTFISPDYQKVMSSRSHKPSELLYPGVDGTRFAPRERSARLEKELGLEDRQVLLYSGAIADIHDFTAFLQALPALSRDYPDVTIVQVGHNLIPDITGQMIEELDIAGHVLLAGAVPHHRMPDYLALADAFLAPVKKNAFNQHRLPSKIPEYMAMGRPILITDFGFGRQLDADTEVVKSDSDEPEDIAAALRELFAKRDDWPQMGKRLRAKAEDLFDWRHNTERLVAFYERMLQQGEQDRHGGSVTWEQALSLAEVGYSRRSPVLEESDLIQAPRATPRVVIFTDGRLGRKMGGIGIRYWEIARALSEHFDVSLGHRYEDNVTGDGFEVFQWRAEDPVHALEVAGQADVVLVHGFLLEKLPELKKIKGRLVVDLHCPYVFENLELHRDRLVQLDYRDRIHSNDLRVLRDQLLLGDYFLCSNERQRDWIIGMLTALNRLRPSTCHEGMRTEDIVAEVPLGLPSERPHREGTVMRGVWPGIEPDDVILLWGGGIWSWLDPLTLIQAMEQVTAKRPDVKLVFLSTRTAEPDLIQMPLQEQAIRLATDLGLNGRSVIFNTESYIGYAERSAYFLEADVGVCAHKPSLETHFAFRTRMLDYFHCGLPVITTRGDYFGDLVEKNGLGLSVDFHDPRGWSDAILALVEDEDRMEHCRDRVLEIRETFTWPRVVAPLVDYCLHGPKRALPRRLGLEMTSPPGSVPLSSDQPHVAAPAASVLAAAGQPPEEMSTLELFREVRGGITGLHDQLAQHREHLAWLQAEHQRTLDVLRVVKLQIDFLRKIPFAERIWRLVKRIKHPHLADRSTP